MTRYSQTATRPRRDAIDLAVCQGPDHCKSTDRLTQGWATGPAADDVKAWPESVDTRRGELPAFRYHYAPSGKIERVDYGTDDGSLVITVWNL